MASQPPQQPQRRPPPPQEQDETSPQIRRADSQAPSTTSIDSQTVFLNSPPSSASPTDPLAAQTAAAATQPPVSTAALLRPAGSDLETRRCWICFSDETDDTPQSSVWRTPCPCALTAHESCLLDWVANIEAPEGSQTTAPPAEIRCPQCKAQIHLSRPRSNLLEAVGAFERYSSKLLLPGVAAGAIYTFVLTFSHHGAHAIRAVFDEHDAATILATRTWAEMNWFEREALERFPSVFKPFFRDWRGLRVELGLPLIPAALIASRTTSAEAFLHIIPVFFFATHASSGETLNFDYWPPSAALTFTLLPYVQSFYNALMGRFWGELEQGWLKEIVPQHGTGDNALDQGQDNAHHIHDDDFEVDFEVELNIGGGAADEDDDDQDDAAPPPNVPGGPPRARDQDAVDDNGVPADLAEAVRVAAEAQEREDAEFVEAAQRREQDGENNNNDQNGDHRIDLISAAHNVADTLFGALLFPLVAEGSGELLRLLLPLSWTVLPRRGRRGGLLAPTGLLQTKWGRSVVGGCLVVALKDAIRIYCRWRMAVNFRARRVRDYDKKLGKLV